MNRKPKSHNCNISYINDPSSTSNTFYNQCCYTESNINNNIVCNSTNGCVMILPSKCVNYTGPYLPTIDVGSNTDLEQILLNINNAITNAGITPNLQAVTNVGNTASNYLFITGSNNPPTSGAGILIGNTGISSYDTLGIFLPITIGSASFDINGTNAGLNSYISHAGNLNIHSNDHLDLRGSSSMTLSVLASHPNNYVILRNNTTGPADVRMKGAPAENSDEFVTLSQAIGLSVNIYNSDGTLTSNRLVNCNSKNLGFVGVADFRVLAGFATFILNDTNFILTDGVNGTLSGQGGNTNLTSPGNLVLWAASNGAASKSIDFRVGNTAHPLILTDVSTGIAGTFSGRVEGQNAVNFNEFMTLGQLANAPNIYNTDGALTGPRVLDGNTTSLTFNNLSQFKAVSILNSSVTIDQFVNLKDAAGNVLDLSTTQIDILGVQDVRAIAPNNLLLQGNSVNILGAASFNQPTTGIDAVNPTHLVTLQQLQGYTSTIDSTSVVSTSITNAYMNTNHSSVPVGGRVLFTNLSDDSSKVLIVNKITSTTWSANIDTKLT